MAGLRNSCRLTTPPWLFYSFFKLYEWYQIAQRITYSLIIVALSHYVINNIFYYFMAHNLFRIFIICLYILSIHCFSYLFIYLITNEKNSCIPTENKSLISFWSHSEKNRRWINNTNGHGSYTFIPKTTCIKVEILHLFDLLNAEILTN